jgi:membrane protease YdiL (CAAX protease family)
MVFSLLYAMYVFNTGSRISLLGNNFLSEMVVVLPTVAVVLYAGDSLRVLAPFKRIKISSALLTLLYVMLLFPLVTLVNSISMLFVDNTILGISDQILELPFWQMLLSIGLFGPFMEEFVFRGVILQSYQRTGRIIGSIVLSSVLFGMIHMNFNQFAYGAAMGIMLALLVEATGSVLTSFIAHAAFNSIEVCMMVFDSDTLQNAESYVGQSDVRELIKAGLGMYFIIAVIATAIAICVLVKISENEGRLAFMRSIPSCKKQGYKLVTIPLVIAFVIALGYMIVTDFLLNLLV